jgi:glycerol uptake facilitator-like aquaporin
MSNITSAGWQKVVGEFVGTTFFLYGVSASTVIPVLVQAESSTGLLITALIQGLSLVAVTAAFSWICGSHINMAVTLTAILTRKIGAGLGCAYMAAQLSGSFIGAGLARASFPQWRDTHLSAPVLGHGVAIYQAYIIETVFTLLLLFVVLGTSSDARAGLYILFPIPVGFALLTSVLIAGPLTGASLSPSRALATALVGDHFEYHYIYWVAPLTAALIATGMYYLVFEVNDQQTRAGPQFPLVPMGNDAHV